MEILLWQLHHLILRVMLFLKVKLIAYCYEKYKGWFWHLYLPFPFKKKVTCFYCKNVGQLLSNISFKTRSHHATSFCKWHQCLLFTDFLIHIFIYLFIHMQYCICELHSSLPEGCTNWGGAKESKRKPDWAAVKLQSCLSNCSRKRLCTLTEVQQVHQPRDSFKMLPFSLQIHNGISESFETTKWSLSWQTLTASL